MVSGFVKGGGVSESTISVDIIWGVEKLNRESVTSWDSENVGEVIFDKEFNISSPEN